MNKIIIIFLILVFLFRQIIILNAKDDTYINTSNIIYNEKEGIVELAEGSKINVNNTNILVDKGIIDYNKETIEVFGNFYLYQELNILSGKDLVGNTKFTKFTANEVSYIYNNDLKIDSDTAKRSGEIVYFYNNFLTPCELNGYFDCPTWSLRIDETRYNIIKDKFNHYDTFIQIADTKVFYLPYFSHYGAKAPRQRGFLTPSMQFSIGGDLGVVAPYYLPLNINTDIIIKPTIIFNDLNNLKLNTNIDHKNAGGNVSIEVNNEKLNTKSDVYNSVKFKSKQILNKNNILTYEALITNSVSTTRSNNENPAAFEDIFIRLDSYDTFFETDYLRSEISTVEALDSTNTGLIPLSPSIKYFSQKLIKDDYTITNKINLINLKRNESELNKPSESTTIKTSNSLIYNSMIGKTVVYNKLILNNNLGNYYYEHNKNLDDEVLRSDLILSSDIFYNLNKTIKPRLKVIQNINIIPDKVINEDSNAITFNYHNQYADSRFYGNDLVDNSGRIIYGSENNLNIFDRDIIINFNQSYDFNKKTNYTNQINQNSNSSDIALEAKTNFDNIKFKIDTRLDNRELEKKEMNYNLDYSNYFDLNLNYNETNTGAFKGISSDTQSLGTSLSKKINDNFIMSFDSNLDLKNNFSPFKQSLKISLFDECSKLDISFVDERFNDNYNTQPSETISISFYMDYLGFFGYEQKSNLFFEETGNFNYGR